MATNLTAGQERLLNEYLAKYPRMAMITQYMCRRTWGAMLLDGYLAPRRFRAEDHDADQEARLAVVRAMPIWDPERSQMATYMPIQIRSALQEYYSSRKHNAEKGKLDSMAFMYRPDSTPVGPEAESAWVGIDATTDYAPDTEPDDVIVAVREMLAELSPVQREVVARCSGIGRERETFRSIAKAKGVSWQRIHQIYTKAKDDLRRMAASHPHLDVARLQRGAPRGVKK